MAVRKINIVEDNTAPPLLLTLKRDGTVIDVTGCTVRLIIARGSTITNTGHQDCTLVTPTSGIVQYDIEDGDFPSPGTYKADVEIEYADGTIERLYDQLNIKARRKLQ